jgi:hypothetical protein
MKMDTTTWMLLAALLLLLIWEWQKKTGKATGSLAGGYYPPGVTPPSQAGKTSLLQQLLGGTGNTQKPPAGTVAGGVGGGGGGGGTTAKPAPTGPFGRNPWKPPGLTQVPTIPSTLGGLIPSIPPPVYNPPTVVYPGEPIATIPSDTSNLFITPDTPPEYPSGGYASGYSGSTGVFTDPETGAPIDVTGGGPILQGVAPPTYDFPTMDYPGAAGTGTTQTTDPTAFSPVDTQTVDTSTLGTIAYQDPTSNPPYDSSTQWYDPTTGTLGPLSGDQTSGGGYDPNLQTSGSGGDWAASEYGFDPGYSADTAMG